MGRGTNDRITEENVAEFAVAYQEALFERMTEDERMEGTSPVLSRKYLYNYICTQINDKNTDESVSGLGIDVLGNKNIRTRLYGILDELETILNPENREAIDKEQLDKFLKEYETIAADPGGFYEYIGIAFKSLQSMAMSLLTSGGTGLILGAILAMAGATSVLGLALPAVIVAIVVTPFVLSFVGWIRHRDGQARREELVATVRRTEHYNPKLFQSPTSSATTAQSSGDSSNAPDVEHSEAENETQKHSELPTSPRSP